MEVVPQETGSKVKLSVFVTLFLGGSPVSALILKGNYISVQSKGVHFRLYIIC